MFTFVDLILVVAIALFTAAGFFFGLIGTIGALIGVAGGAWLAGHYYAPVAKWLSPILLGRQTAANIITFILIFLVANRLFALLFYILNRVFKLFAIIPFFKSINRLAGALLGLIEGILVVGLSVYVIAKLGANIGWLAEALNNSKIAHALVWLTSFLTYFLPEAISRMKSIF